MDAVDAIWDQAVAAAIKERLQFEPLYNIIEEYLARFSKKLPLGRDTSIMLGGSMGVDLIMQRERSLEDFSYELYTESAFQHANDLTNELAAYLGAHKVSFIPLVYLKTGIPDQRYLIYVDNRILVTFLSLRGQQGMVVYDLIKPLQVKTYAGHTCACLSAEIYLFDIYRTLYSPARAEDWESALVEESKLFRLLKRRIGKAASSSTHGADDTNEGGSSEAVSMELRRKIEAALFRDFITNNEQIILLGEHVLALFTKQEKNTNIIQALSARELDLDLVAISKIIRSADASLANVPVKHVHRDIPIMQDFRLRRTTIKIGEEGAQKEVMYLYNSLRYDIMPFYRLHNKTNATQFVQVGNPFVILRFLLIDFWMVRWVLALGGIDEGYAQKRMESIITRILGYRELLPCCEIVKGGVSSKQALPSGPFTIFQERERDYLGHYEDEVVSMKLRLQGATKRYNDYYPQEYLRSNQHYRSVASAERSGQQKSR